MLLRRARPQAPREGRPEGTGYECLPEPEDGDSGTPIIPRAHPSTDVLLKESIVDYLGRAKSKLRSYINHRYGRYEHADTAHDRRDHRPEHVHSITPTFSDVATGRAPPDPPHVLRRASASRQKSKRRKSAQGRRRIRAAWRETPRRPASVSMHSRHTHRFPTSSRRQSTCCCPQTAHASTVGGLESGK